MPKCLRQASCRGCIVPAKCYTAAAAAQGDATSGGLGERTRTYRKGTGRAQRLWQTGGVSPRCRHQWVSASAMCVGVFPRGCDPRTQRGSRDCVSPQRKAAVVGRSSGERAIGSVVTVAVVVWWRCGYVSRRRWFDARCGVVRSMHVRSAWRCCFSPHFLGE